MAYSRGQDAVDDFDDYDPTPYNGGYDITFTYGRPLPPSDEICHSRSTSSSGIDYERPHFSSCSAYGDAALSTEYNSYLRPKPKPQPAYDFQPGRTHKEEGVAGEFGYGGRPKPQPNYGFQPGLNRPGYGGEGEFGYGRRPDFQDPSSEHGSGYGRNPQFGSGYGGSPNYGGIQESGSGAYGYGSEYKRTEEIGYGRRTETPEYGRPSYGGEPARMPEYGRPSYEHPREEERRNPSYGRPGYGREEEEQYRKPSYERPSYGRGEGEEEAWRYQERSYGEGEGYSQKKYGGNNSDDEEKKHHHHRHHHR